MRTSTAIDTIELDDGRLIHGFVDDGYGAVMDTFLANFRDRHELGASCAVYRGGVTVVELWGGIADARTARPWERDTSAVIFSCSKALVAICAYLLVQEGRLDLDVPVARYWPEFGAAGKGAITLRDAMSHRAGLPALERDLSTDNVLAWDPVIQAIQVQTPLHAPEAGHFYHAMTYGWLVGEIVRRLTGQTPGQWFRAQVAAPLGLRTWIGLPAEATRTVAWMEAPLPDEESDAARESARIWAENPVIERSLTMGGAYAFPAEDGFVTFNDPAIQAGEIPAANGISTAESLARMFAACVSDVDGLRLLSQAAIEDLLVCRSRGPQLSGIPDDGACWGTGFQLASPPSQPMLGSRSFGHAGAGGQLGFADADHGDRLRVSRQPDGRLRRRAGARIDPGAPRRDRRLSPGPSRTMEPSGIEPRPQLLTYPDSLGGDLRTLGALLDGPLAGLFHGVHILPPFPSSGDRGFAPLTYREIDPRFGGWADVEHIAEGHDVLLDLMVNHISRQSPEFQDFLRRGRASPFADLFITLDKIWPGGNPAASDVARIFLRKPNAPFSTVTISDSGAEERIWTSFGTADWSEQIDLDVTSDTTRALITDWLRFLADHGARIVRLDAVGYVIKKPGTTCFMVEPEIYGFLGWVTSVAGSFGLVVLPEVHDVPSTHERLAGHGFWTYDFVLPALLITAFRTGDHGTAGQPPRPIPDAPVHHARLS